MILVDVVQPYKGVEDQESRSPLVHRLEQAVAVGDEIEPYLAFGDDMQGNLFQGRIAARFRGLVREAH